MSRGLSAEFQGFNQFVPISMTGPAAPYTAAGPSDISDETSSKSSKKSSGSSGSFSLGGLDSNMVKLLTDHGLESDVYSFLSEMEGAIMNAYDPTTGKVNYTAYKLILPKLARIREEGKAFEEARKKMEENGSINEAAVNDKGFVYVMTEEGIQLMDPSEVTASTRVLTNGEIAKARATNPTGAWNTDFTTTMANGIGTLKITQYLLSAIQQVGKSSSELDQYTGANGEVLKGALVLQEMLQGSKAFTKESIKQSSNSELVKLALKYVAKTLPTNIQAVLQVKAAQSNSSVPELLSSIILSKVTEDYSYKSEVKGAGSGDGSAADKQASLNLDPVTMFMLGKTPTTERIINTGGSYQFKGTAHVGTALDSSGHAIGYGESLTKLLSGKYAGALDTENATMGSQKISNPNLVKLDNESMYSMELPIDLRALTDRFEGGVVRPDLALLSRYEAANKYLRDLGIDINSGSLSAEQKLQVNDTYTSSQYNLPPMFDAQGNKYEANYAPFVILKGYADRKAFKDNIGFDETILPITDQNLAESLSLLYTPSDKTAKTLYKYDASNMISGNIYIPMLSIQQGYENSLLGAMQASGSHLTSQQANNLTIEQAHSDFRQQTGFVTAGSFSANALK